MRDPIPLVPKFNSNQALGSRQIYNVLKSLSYEAADILDAEEPLLAQDLRDASPHWLRHTQGTLWANSGLDIRILQDMLGHTNPQTTQIYTHVSSKKVTQEAEHYNKKMKDLLK